LQFILPEIFLAQDECMQTCEDGAQESDRRPGFRGQHPPEVRRFGRNRRQTWTVRL